MTRYPEVLKGRVREFFHVLREFPRISVPDLLSAVQLNPTKPIKSLAIELHRKKDE